MAARLGRAFRCLVFRASASIAHSTFLHHPRRQPGLRSPILGILRSDALPEAGAALLECRLTRSFPHPLSKPMRLGPVRLCCPVGARLPSPLRVPTRAEVAGTALASAPPAPRCGWLPARRLPASPSPVALAFDVLAQCCIPGRGSLFDSREQSPREGTLLNQTGHFYFNRTQEGECSCEPSASRVILATEEKQVFPMP